LSRRETASSTGRRMAIRKPGDPEADGGVA
jgi:hypothetical protein